MSLYQPFTRSISQRGCLTPNNHPEIDHDSKLLIKQPIATSNTRSSILSPPLSPYQRNPISHNDEVPTTPIEQTTSSIKPYKVSKNYITSTKPFKVENYKSYKLTVNPWNNLKSNYKQRQLNFLQQYSIMSNRESYSNIRLIDRRGPYKKKFLNSDSDSESNNERIRTRRIIKENSIQLPSDSETSSSIPSSPKKQRKVRKDPPYAGSPLAIQQASFIDENIPDYSPDTSLTLPANNSRALKVEWKGQPMDLKNDPNASKLHPAEVVLASTLRLPCNVYLDSKRRLFFEKVSRLKNGMQFRRTDAQKACRIDVNKASRLFAAFEKVGWLNDEHFAKYL